MKKTEIGIISTGKEKLNQYKNMPFKPPVKMIIMSDGSEVELVKIIQKDKNRKEDSYLYKFQKSITKENTEFEMTEVQIKMNLRNFFREIKN